MSPGALGIALALAAAGIEAFAQVALKLATRAHGRKGRWRLAGLLLFGVEAAVYTWSLRYLDVSTAFPLGSLSFVFVALLSQGLLEEPVDRARWVGVLLIVMGSSLVAARA